MKDSFVGRNAGVIAGQPFSNRHHVLLLSVIRRVSLFEIIIRALNSHSLGVRLTHSSTNLTLSLIVHPISLILHLV